MKAMTERRLSICGLGCALSLLAPPGVFAAEGDQMLATVDRPAVVVASPVPDAAAANQASRVVINVTGYTPPQAGAVEAIVKAQKADGTDQEIGRFAMFPDSEYRTNDPSGAQRFGFSLPRELAQGGRVKLKVELVPARGKGEGARLEVGGAEIR
jgi:hypothetical protein